MKNENIARKVRDKYGDSVEEFAFRLGVAPATIMKWELGFKLNSLHSSILEYAYKYDMSMKHEAPDFFDKFSARYKIDYLMDYYCCSVDALAIRLRIDKLSLRRWKTTNSLSACAKRFLCEVVAHPERFTLF